MSADMDSGPPKQPGSGLSAVLKTLNQNILMMDKDFEAPGPSSDRYRTSSPPKIIHGIIRNSPAALLNTQPTYFSERACATPMIPPSTGDFKSEMRDMEAHIGAYAHPPGETHAEKRHKKALDRAFRMRKERGYRLSSPSNVIVAGDPFHTPVQKIPRRLILSQPRPPMNEDEDADADDEDDGGDDFDQGDGGDGFEEREVQDTDAEESDGTSEDDSMGDDSVDHLPLDDWQPMLESDDIFLSSNKASKPQPQPPAKSTRPMIVVQDSEDNGPVIIDDAKHASSKIPIEEHAVSETPTKKRKKVSFAGPAAVESDDSSELTSLNPDDVDSDLEVLSSRPKPAPQSQQPAPEARRRIFKPMKPAPQSQQPAPQARRPVFKPKPAPQGQQSDSESQQPALQARRPVSKPKPAPPGQQSDPESQQPAPQARRPIFKPKPAPESQQFDSESQQFDSESQQPVSQARRPIFKSKPAPQSQQPDPQNQQSTPQARRPIFKPRPALQSQQLDPQSQQPTPQARRPVFIKTEVKSPKPAVPSVPKTTSKPRKRLQPVKQEEDPSSEDVGEDEPFEDGDDEDDEEDENDEDEDDDDYEDVMLGSDKRKRNSEGRFVRNTRPARATGNARKARKSSSSRRTAPSSNAPVSNPASALSTAASSNSTNSSALHSSGPRPFVPMNSRNSFTGDRTYHTMGPRVVKKGYFDKK